jgi:hypothetical protein
MKAVCARCSCGVQVELHMGVVLNDLAVALLMHLEAEVSRTRERSKKIAKRGAWTLALRSPFDDEVRPACSTRMLVAVGLEC